MADVRWCPPTLTPDCVRGVGCRVEIGHSVKRRPCASRVFPACLGVVCCGHRACVWSWCGSAAQNHSHLNISVVLTEKPLMLSASFFFGANTKLLSFAWPPVLMNTCAIYSDVSSGILAKFFVLTAEVMASKQGLNCMSADGWECLELQGPCGSLCPGDQWLFSQGFLPTTNSSLGRLIGKECGCSLIKYL